MMVPDGASACNGANGVHDSKQTFWTLRRLAILKQVWHKRHAVSLIATFYV